MRVYLGGPINGCTDDEAHGWRDEVAAELRALGHEPIDPMVRDYRGRELDPGIAAEIVENDKADINAADVLLMNCPRPSVGTAMEILYAWERGKRVVSIVPYGHTPSPWLIYHSNRVVEGSVRGALTCL